MSAVAERLAFPSSFDELEQKSTEVGAIIRDYKAQIRALTEKSRKTEDFATLLNALLDSWAQADPGKYRSAVFFLDKAARRVCVKEMLPADAQRFSPEEWKALEWDKRRSMRGVVRGYPIIPFADILTGRHPEKGTILPVLEWYVQTEDGPHGDEWQKCAIMLDMDDSEVIVIDRNLSDSRW